MALPQFDMHHTRTTVPLSRLGKRRANINADS